MLAPLVQITLVLHANLFRNVKRSTIARRDKGNNTRETQLLQSVIFERLNALYRQTMLPVRTGQHIGQFYLRLLLHLLTQQATLPNKALITLENGRKERMTVELVLFDVS